MKKTWIFTALVLAAHALYECGPEDAKAPFCSDSAYKSLLHLQGAELYTDQPRTVLNENGLPADGDVNVDYNCWLGNRQQSRPWGEDTNASYVCPTTITRNFLIWQPDRYVNSCDGWQVADGKYCYSTNPKDFNKSSLQVNGEPIMDMYSNGPYVFAYNDKSPITGRITLDMQLCSMFSQAHECAWPYMEDYYKLNYGISYGENRVPFEAMEVKGKSEHVFVGKVESTGGGDPFIIDKIYVQNHFTKAWEEYKDAKTARLSDEPSGIIYPEQRDKGVFARMVYAKKKEGFQHLRPKLKLELIPERCYEPMIYKIKTSGNQLLLSGQEPGWSPYKRKTYYLHPDAMGHCDGAMSQMQWDKTPGGNAYIHCSSAWDSRHLAYTHWYDGALFYQQREGEERSWIVIVKGDLNAPNCTEEPKQVLQPAFSTYRSTKAPDYYSVSKEYNAGWKFDKGIKARAAGQDIALKFTITPEFHTDVNRLRYLLIDAGNTDVKVAYRRGNVVFKRTDPWQWDTGAWINADLANGIKKRFDMNTPTTKLFYIVPHPNAAWEFIIEFHNVKPGDIALRDFKLKLINVVPGSNESDINNITDAITIEHDPLLVRPERFRYIEGYDFHAYSTAHKQISPGISNYISSYTSDTTSALNGQFHIDHAEYFIKPLDEKITYRFYDKVNHEWFNKSTTDYKIPDGNINSVTRLFFPLVPYEDISYALIDDTLEQYCKEHGLDVRNYCNEVVNIDVASANSLDSKGRIACNTPGALKIRMRSFDPEGKDLNGTREELDQKYSVIKKKIELTPDENARANALIANNTNFAVRVDYKERREFSATNQTPLAFETKGDWVIDPIITTSGVDLSALKRMRATVLPNSDTRAYEIDQDAGLIIVGQKEANAGFLKSLHKLCASSVCLRGFASNNFVTKQKIRQADGSLKDQSVPLLRNLNADRESRTVKMIDNNRPEYGLVDLSWGQLKFAAEEDDHAKSVYYNVFLPNNEALRKSAKIDFKYGINGINQISLPAISLAVLFKDQKFTTTKALAAKSTQVDASGDYNGSPVFSIKDTNDPAHFPLNISYLDDGYKKLKYLEDSAYFNRSECGFNSGNYCINASAYRRDFGSNLGFDSRFNSVQLVSAYNNAIKICPNEKDEEFIFIPPNADAATIDRLKAQKAAIKCQLKSGASAPSEWEYFILKGRRSTYVKDTINCLANGVVCPSFSIEYKVEN